MKILIALFLSILISMPVHADLLGETDNLFNNMINVTTGGTAMSQSRGVLAGPNVSVRNRISNVNLVNFRAPNVDAGCGGIDIFGGSFSFINAQQFSQMLRNIAANATGYAFGLALNAMCPTCKQEMDKLQKMINSMNKGLMDSCSMAKWMVNQTSLDDLANERLNEVKHDNASVLTDWFDASFLDNLPWQTSAGAGSTETTFNVTENALVQSNVTAWYAAGDEDLKMKIVSFLGTVTALPDPADPESRPLLGTKPPLIDLEDLLDGTEDATIYACVAGVPNCADMSENPNQTIVGLKDYVRAILAGNTGANAIASISNSPGLFTKYQTNIGPLTTEEQQFVETAPAPIAAMLRNLARLNAGSGEMFINASSDLIALEYTYALSKDFIKAAKIALANADVPGKELFMQDLDDREQQIAQSYLDYSKKLENVAGLYEQYQLLMTGIEPRQHGITSPPKK